MSPISCSSVKLLFETERKERNGVFIKADKIRIYEVILNLLKNAIKFTKEGTISIATEEKEKKKKTDKGEVIVKVKDTSSSKQLIKTKRNQRSLKSSSREYRLKIIRKMTTATDILKFQDQSQDKEKKEGVEENGKVVITWNPIKEIKRYRRTGDPIRHIDLNSILNFIVRKVAVKYPDIMTKYLCGENGSIIKKAFQRKEQEIELRKALTSGYLIQLQYSIESFSLDFIM